MSLKKEKAVSSYVKQNYPQIEPAHPRPRAAALRQVRWTNTPCNHFCTWRNRHQKKRRGIISGYVISNRHFRLCWFLPPCGAADQTDVRSLIGFRKGFVCDCVCRLMHVSVEMYPIYLTFHTPPVLHNSWLCFSKQSTRGWFPPSLHTYALPTNANLILVHAWC